MLKTLAIGCATLVGLFLILVVVLAVAGGKAADKAVTSAKSSSGTAAVTGKVGDVLRVGDLDLKIASVQPFNSTTYNQFNDATVAVNLQATNARGKANATYDFSPGLALKLVDSSGLAHDPDTCAGCPSAIGDNGSAKLIPGGSAQGNVYYKVPAGVSLTQIWYQPLFSGNKATINVGP